MKMAGRKPRASKVPGGGSDKSGRVVAHPETKLRDVENLLRYVKRLDEKRGID